MQIWLDIQTLGGVPLMSTLVLTMSLGPLKSNQLFLILILKLNINPWLPPLLNSLGSLIYFMILVSLSWCHHSSCVTTSVLFTCQLIQSFMRALTILNLVIILSEKQFSQETSSHGLFALLTKLLMYLQKPHQNLNSSILLTSWEFFACHSPT